jgi:hypothetical protein
MDPIGQNQLLIFTGVGALTILVVTGIGYYYFCRWAKKEKETGRRFIDAHLAEVMRDKPEEDE